MPKAKCFVCGPRECGHDRAIKIPHGPAMLSAKALREVKLPVVTPSPKATSMNFLSENDRTLTDALGGYLELMGAKCVGTCDWDCGCSRSKPCAKHRRAICGRDWRTGIYY